MALITDPLPADLSPDASADAPPRINIRKVSYNCVTIDNKAITIVSAIIEPGTNSTVLSALEDSLFHK